MTVKAVEVTFFRPVGGEVGIFKVKIPKKCLA